MRRFQSVGVAVCALAAFAARAQGGAPVPGSRESAVAPKSFARLPAKSPLFLPPATNANLLVNASFEMGKAGHQVATETAFGPGAPQAKVTVDETVAKDGRRSLRIETPADCKASLIGTAPRVGGGAQVVYSVWLKAARPTTVRVELFGVNVDMWGTGQTIWKGMPVDFKVTEEWKRCPVPFKTDAAQAWLCPRLVFAGDSVCWVDAEQLEVTSGRKPTEFRPAAPVEAAFELDGRIFAQRDGSFDPAHPPVREARLLAYDYAAAKLTVERRTFATPKYGCFSLEAEVAGRPALPADYAVVHALDPYPGKGLFIGMNGGQPALRHGWNSARQYLFDGEGDGDYWRLLRLAGMRLLRLWDGDLGWRTCEPRKGEYDWTPLDNVLDGTRRAGMDAMFVLGATAFLKWNDPARDKAHTNWFVRLGAKPAKKSGMPQWTTGLEIRDADWDDFNRDLARHAKGRLKYYEIVNEPNLQVADADYYVHLMKLAYGRIKAEDPSATVVGICSTGDFGGNLGGYIGEVGKRGGFQYLDWMSFHPYSGPTDVTPKPAERQLVEVSALVAKYRPGCPVIEDELYYICDNNAEKGSNRGCNWRASNVIRRYVLDFAGGCVASAPLAREQIWHQGPEMSGLNGRPSLMAHHLYANELYVASNAFAHFLEGGRFVARPDLAKGLNGAAFENVRGERVVVIWAKRAEDRQTVAVPDGAVAYDLFGNSLNAKTVDVTEDAVYLVFPPKSR